MQGHFDMVCEKEPEVEIDFDNDPIDLFIDGEYVTAKGTTLGADNGIAIAMTFAFLEENIETCQIEVLLTVEEETGLFGATNLNPEMPPFGPIGVGLTVMSYHSPEDLGIIRDRPDRG